MSLREVVLSLARSVARQALRKGRRTPSDFTAEDRSVWERVRSYTMTSPERVQALREAVKHVIRAGIDGAIVECGVWRGGSMMAVALTLLELGRDDVELYLFDTFNGMTEPTSADIDATGASAQSLLQSRDKGSDVWAVGPIADVRRAMASTGYPAENVVYVSGPVEQTIPTAAPEKIALLRLDTDWYESTKHELIHLFPRLAPGGVLVIDDYGHWEGARRAVDEYVAELGLNLLLVRVDYTGRVAVKPFDH